MSNTKLTVFGIMFSPIVLIGVVAWCLWTALAVGWNMVDAAALESYKEREHGN